MPSWPLTLPHYPLLNGYQTSGTDTVIRSQPSAGPPLSRRRFTAAVRPVNCSIKVGTLALKDVLDAFFRDDLEDGALPFTWAGLSESTGGGTGSFMFAGPPDYQPEGAQRWRISMQLLRLP